MGILELNSLEKLVFSLLGSDCESSSTMLMLLVLPCLLGLVVEVFSQDYPPTHPPLPYPSSQQPPAYEPHHQPGYAPAGYAPAQGYGGSGGNWKDLLSDPTTMMLLMQQEDRLAGDKLMLMASMMGHKNGGLSSDPLAMMALLGGGKKLNPFLMSTLLQCKEKHLECTQPNNLRHEVCGIKEDEYQYSGVTGRELLPCCTCKKTEETTAPWYT